MAMDVAALFSRASGYAPISRTAGFFTASGTDGLAEQLSLFYSRTRHSFSQDSLRQSSLPQRAYPHAP
jgi:hypothetical protein